MTRDEQDGPVIRGGFLVSWPPHPSQAELRPIHGRRPRIGLSTSFSLAVITPGGNPSAFTAKFGGLLRVFFLKKTLATPAVSRDFSPFIFGPQFLCATPSCPILLTPKTPSENRLFPRPTIRPSWANLKGSRPCERSPACTLAAP